MLRENLWHEIVKLTLANGGLTINPRNGEVYNGQGYAVGGVLPSVTVPVNSDWHEMVKDFVLSNAEIFLNGRPVYLGTWIDGDVVWLDASEIYEDLDTALTVARERGEKAIWDFANQREIYV